MNKSTLAALLLVATAFPAIAAESPCNHSLAELKAAAPKDAKFYPLNAGQYHFAAGMFVATPPVSAALPPSDGAIIISLKAEKIAAVLWMLHGKLCPGRFDITPPVAALILSVNPKPGETIEIPKDGSDVHL